MLYNVHLNSQNDFYRLQLIRFASNHSIIGDTSYTNLILDIENNMKWLEEQGPGLEEWLMKHKPTTLPPDVVKRTTSSLSVPSTNHWQPEAKSYSSELNEF